MFPEKDVTRILCNCTGFSMNMQKSARDECTMSQNTQGQNLMRDFTFMIHFIEGQNQNHT